MRDAALPQSRADQSIGSERNDSSTAASSGSSAFSGNHQFYYGRPITGTIWFLTHGLLGVGWLIDLFLMPSMDRDADRRYRTGPFDYTFAWVLLTFLGLFGLHRLYLGKWPTAILYFLSAGLFGIGLLYDFWTLNEQADEANALA